MTYRSLAWRGGLAVGFASVGLLACPGGGGGGGSCPELSGDWQASGCSNTACEISQDGCALTIECDDGTTFKGTARSGSVSFQDDNVQCSGDIEGLDDEVNGAIAPRLDGMCRPIADGGGEACEFNAGCQSGDCTMPQDDDQGGDGDGDGNGDGDGDGNGDGDGDGNGDGDGDGDGDSGEGGAGGFLGGGTGGVGGDGGAGTGGQGGSGDGTGAIDPDTCGNCVITACEAEATECANAGQCADVVDCALASTCSLDDDDCVDSVCADTFSGITLTQEAADALDTLQSCVGAVCTDECFSSGGPVGGDGGSGGSGGDGGGVSCEDTCEYAFDDECDDGGDGNTQYCPLGTDCADCGPR